MAKRDIYARLDALRPAVWDGPAFRQSAAQYGRGRVLNGQGALHQGGRWNPPDSFRTVYASLEIETVVAESRRSVAPERWADVAATHVLWGMRARVDNLVDLRPTRHRQAVGLPVDFDDAVSRESTQAIGEAAYYVRYKGMLVPSAARPGGINFIVFPDNLESTDFLELNPGEPQRLAEALA